MSVTNTKTPVAKVPPAAPTDATPSEVPVRERRKLSLHYGAPSTGGRP